MEGEAFWMYNCNHPSTARTTIVSYMFKIKLQKLMPGCGWIDVFRETTTNRLNLLNMSKTTSATAWSSKLIGSMVPLAMAMVDSMRTKSVAADGHCWSQRNSSWILEFVSTKKLEYGRLTSQSLYVLCAWNESWMSTYMGNDCKVSSCNNLGRQAKYAALENWQWKLTWGLANNLALAS